MADSEVENLKTLLRMCFLVNGEFQLEAVNAYFKTRRNDLTYAEKLSAFCDSVIQNFCKIDVNDVSLIARIIDLLSASRDPNIAHNLPNDSYKELIKEAMNLALTKRQESEHFHICRELDFQQVAKTIYGGHVDLMKILVRYGVCQSPDENESTVSSRNVLSQRRNFDRENILTEAAAIYVSFELTDEHRMKFSSRRSLLVSGVLVIEKCVHEEDVIVKSVIRKMMKCYKLYFQTVTDPIVTMEEKKFFFNNKIMSRKNAADGEAREGTGIEENPEVTEVECLTSNKPYQPRSLLHLSRCQVRKDLRKMGTLPRLVLKLPIPPALKPLLLSDDESTFIH